MYASWFTELIYRMQNWIRLLSHYFFPITCSLFTFFSSVVYFNDKDKLLWNRNFSSEMLIRHNIMRFCCAIHCSQSHIGFQFVIFAFSLNLFLGSLQKTNRMDLIGVSRICPYATKQFSVPYGIMFFKEHLIGEWTMIS